MIILFQVILVLKYQKVCTGLGQLIQQKKLVRWVPITAPQLKTVEFSVQTNNAKKIIVPRVICFLIFVPQDRKNQVVTPMFMGGKKVLSATVVVIVLSVFENRI